jgi:two-component system, sensor histidine kinase RegB
MESAKRREGTAWYLEATPAAVSKWLVRLRRAAAAIDAEVVASSFALPSATFPLRRLAPLVAASAFMNAEQAVRTTGRRPASRVVDGAALLLQVVLLTGLLELSGGPSNPFSAIYVVLIALAALTLGAGWAYLVGGWSIACYAVLIAWHLEELVPSHHRLIDFLTHLFTMWFAIRILGELAGHFVGAASRAVALREAQLDAMRQREARTAHLVSLTTLAAGAAHELSTPLATIAIASKELERTLARPGVRPQCAADAKLIREEVDRCQIILDQMSGRAGGSAAEAPETVRVDAVVAEVKARLAADLADRMRTQVKPGLPPIVAPRAGLVQVLLSLVRNAFDATDGAEPVTLEVEADDGLFRFVVRDQGRGMSEDTLRRAGEPFYTTKDPGHGRGLGLFLARAFAERCGGSLSLRSGQGTTAILELLAASRLEAAS